jgi:UDP-2-acetamido-2,6-beta-L-arabino-hexul-4-ose reductase
MKILITGANGFVGKNLVAQLNNIKSGKAKHSVLGNDLVIFEFDRESPIEILEQACQEVDFVFHLAGVNRPKEESEFMEGNFGFTSLLLETLKKNNNYCPIMLSSSTQAELDNPYGKSKRAGEEVVRNFFKQNENVTNHQSPVTNHQ